MQMILNLAVVLTAFEVLHDKDLLSNVAIGEGRGRDSFTRFSMELGEAVCVR